MQLTLDDVQKCDAGTYTVSVKSPMGTTSRDIELRIAVEGDQDDTPVFLRRLNDLSVKVGTKTRFLVELYSVTQLSVRQIITANIHFYVGGISISLSAI